jgi:copper transport protein
VSPRRLLGALALACLAGLAAPQAAAAHAVLVSTSPERGERVDEAPGEVSLRFNEPVEASFGAVRVFDARGERVDEGDVTRPGGDSDAVGVALPRGLEEGAYTATFRVVSADSHPVSGGFVFNVGQGGAAPAATVAELIDEGDAGTATSVGFGVVRGLAYLAIALAVGGVVFLGAIWLPGLRAAGGAGPEWGAASEAFAARFGRLAGWTVGLGVVATALGIVLQGANASGTSFWSALDPDVIGDVLGTRFGTVWGLRLLDWVLLGVVATAAVAGARLPVLRPASLGASGNAAGRLASLPVLAALALLLGFLVVSPGLSGHAGTTDPVVPMQVANSSHVLAMSLWTGGLAGLLLVLPAATRRLEPPDRTRLLAACLRRFSPLALASVATLLATGIFQSIVHLESLGDLTGSAFGRAILVKAALLIVLITLGALNMRSNRPALERFAVEGAAPGGAGRLLRRAVQAEVALIMVVLGVTAALTTYPPPGAEAGGPFSTSTELGPARLELTVDPASTGSNEIHLYLFDPRDGSQYDRLKGLEIRLRLPDKQIGPLEPRIDKAGPGHYVARRALISPAGDWELDVFARVSEFEEHRAEVEVPIE